jgi:hypothetical protein
MPAEFHADVSAADDEEFFRNDVERDGLGGAEDELSIVRQGGQRHRGRAGGDEDVFRGVGCPADVDGVGRSDFAQAAQVGDLVFF